MENKPQGKQQAAQYYMQSQENAVQENNMPMKSPSVVSFGTYNNQATTKLMFPSNNGNQTVSDPLQELTLNKQGHVVQGSGKPKVNPKDLSNEELEYIIRTGQIPPRLNASQPQMQQQQQPQQQQQIQMASNPLMEKTYQMHQNQMQSTNVFQQNLGNSTVNYSYSGMAQGMIPPQYDKENFVAKNVTQGKIIDYDDPEVQAKLHRNFNSPKQINNTTGTTDKSQRQFQIDSLLMSREQPIDKTLDVSTTSQAASQCLKALQDKISQLEKDKQILHDQLTHTQSQKQQQNTIHTENMRLKEEVSMLMRSLQAKEHEKQRHLEENYMQQEQLKSRQKVFEEENLRLKREMEDQVEKYEEIQGIIQDLKKRESQVRDKCDKEAVAEKSRAEQAEKELIETKSRYEELKKKLKDQMREVLDENTRLKEQHQQQIESLEVQRDRWQREADKLKREVQLLKEEVSIIGSHSIDNHYIGNAKAKKKLSNSSSAMTPKGSEIQIKTARCKSPKRMNEQVIRLQQVISQEAVDLLSSKQSTVKKAKKTNKSNTGSTSKSLRNRSKNNLGTKDSLEHTSKTQIASTGKLQSSERKSSSRTHKTKKSQTRSQSASKKPHKNMMKQIASESQLISINTLENKADNYIFIDQSQSNKKESINQYKRPSLESTSSILQFSSVGGASDMGGQFSQMSSIDVRKPMELQDIGVSKIMDRQSIDNKIFYLEREIFDCNQQYKTLLGQQSMQTQHTQSQNVNSNLRQIAQKLEEKSERLFELKKQQQQILMQDTYGSVSSGVKQVKRSLSELDTLFLRQEQLRNQISNDVANKIEQNPDLYYNHEKFRQWQAKARFRALITTSIVVPTLFTLINGGQNGIGLMRAKPLLSVPVTLGVFVSSFFVWHRAVGFNSQLAMEQAFAKNHKMLRNMLIQQ